MRVTPVTQKQLKPRSTRDLCPSERRFLSAMRQLGHGRFESLRIQQGELVLEPPPTAVRSVKFGKPTPNRPEHPSSTFDLKQEVAQLFGFVRGVDAGEIRVLEVRGGLPLYMDIAARCDTAEQPMKTKEGEL